MTTIATLGPQDSFAWQAAKLYDPAADIRIFHTINAVITCFQNGQADYALVPVYNTREGEIKEYFRLMEKLSDVFWVDNVLLPIHLSLGALTDSDEIRLLFGRASFFKQCEEYIADKFPNTTLKAVPEIETAIEEMIRNNLLNHGAIGAEPVLKRLGLVIRERELASYNRTRFALLGKKIPRATGYDATAIITTPLMDRVGLLYDTLGEFARRGISLIDLRSETDVKTQKLQIYIEAEGHIEDVNIRSALEKIEKNIIQEQDSIKVLGSYPRLDMREKRIKKIGFIGTGDMSRWFAAKLQGEGYQTLLTGRTSTLRPEEMIPRVEVVIICVPISNTVECVMQYGPCLQDGQAVIIMAGEAESAISGAMEHTRQGVEVMLVHNLWGPQAANMKDKNVSVVRTSRSGALCSEFEAFLYKHGAEVSLDSAKQHDLLMGVGQKLPTSISVALAMTLTDNDIAPEDIGSHSTLTSLYGILAMSRVHSQLPRTYAEIMAARGDGRKIVRSFLQNLTTVLNMADEGKLEELCAIIENSKEYLGESFLKNRMRQALAVDSTLGKMIHD